MHSVAAVKRWSDPELLQCLALKSLPFHLGASRKFHVKGMCCSATGALNHHYSKLAFLLICGFNSS